MQCIITEKQSIHLEFLRLKGGLSESSLIKMPHCTCHGSYFLLFIQVSATDADHSTTNNAIDYFIIDTNNVFDDGYIYVNSYGNLYVNTSWTSPTFDFDMIIEFEVVAQNMVDNTQTRLAATATVSLVLAAVSTQYFRYAG